MRLSIALCRYCPQKGNCLYADRMRLYTSKIPLPYTICWRCPHYKEVWRIGERVKIEIKDNILTEETEEGGGWDEPYRVGSWEHNCFATGKIIGIPLNNKVKLFVIELDKSVEITRIQQGEEYRKRTEFYGKVANQIKRIGGKNEQTKMV